MTSDTTNLSRRGFLQTVGASALVLTFPTSIRAEEKASPDGSSTATITNWLRIDRDGTVTISSANPEIGQGVETSLPMLVAEELDVAWEKVRVETAPLDGSRFGRQMTGGSRAVNARWKELRQVGAAARAMLVSAAAKELGVSTAALETELGHVVHEASGRKLAYGSLVSAASKLPVPAFDKVTLKARKDFRIIGHGRPQYASRAIVTGAPLFGVDVMRPGMLYATYEKSGVPGAEVASADLEAARAVKGVTHAFIVKGSQDVDRMLPGVAVVADTWWAAMKGRRQLKTTWAKHATQSQSSESFAQQAKALGASNPQEQARTDGDTRAALDAANKKLRAVYQYAFVAHATLEPMNCTAHFADGKLEMWAPTQFPEAGRNMVAKLLGMSVDDVTVHFVRSGGGFGRRAANDFMAEAAWIAREVGVPVQLLWSREDDFRHDTYRPGGFHFLQAGLDENGKLSAWDAHFVTFDAPGRFAGSTDMPANQFPAGFVPNFRQGISRMKLGHACGALRAPRANVLAFVSQSFIDEIAHAAAADPLQFRLDLLGQNDVVGEGRNAYGAGRMRRVLSEVRKMSGWDERRRKLPERSGLGVAFQYSHRGYFAEVVQVAVSPRGVPKVEKVWVAADVGSQIVNPTGALNQVQGAVIDGLSVALYQKITFRDGAVVQGNFHDYRLLRMSEAPPVEVRFVESANEPTGLGEPGLPPAIPALANAIFDATGVRIRELPIDTTKLKV